MILKFFSLSDTQEEIKTKYRKLALEHHPDKNPDRQAEATQTMQQINAEMKYIMSNRIQSGQPVSSFDDLINEILKDQKMSSRAKIWAEVIMRSVFAGLLIYNIYNQKTKK